METGDIRLSVMPGKAGGTLTASGAANQVAVFSSPTNLNGYADLTYDSVNKILSTVEVDIGATPFKFLDTAGVLQLGDANLTWTAASKVLSIGAGGGLITTFMTSDPVFSAPAFNAPTTGGTVGSPLVYFGANDDVLNWAAALIEGGPYEIGWQVAGTYAANPISALFGDINSTFIAGSSVAIICNQGAWYVQTSADGGAWVPGNGVGNDNAQDLGLSNGRVRTGFFGTSVLVDDGAGNGFVNVAAGYQVGGVPGVPTATFLSGDVIPKTITVTGGIITGVV